MAHAQLSPVLRHIRGLVAAHITREQADADLLEAFSFRKDETAFIALVRRHGPMVLGVCRQALGHEQDAEDAFQATFLVLARRAASIRKGEALGSWLHGVAYHTAMKAKTSAARRRAHEAQAKVPPQRDPSWQAASRELQTALNEEIQRLPSKYRDPFVLCFLEGQSRAEVARQLRLKEGTVWSRLSEARRHLQQRLARRGVALSAALGALGLAGDTASAAIPACLLKSTSKAAVAFATSPAAADLVSAKVAALTKAVMPTILSTKLNIAPIVLVLGLALGAASFLTHRALAERTIPTPNPQAPPAQAAKKERPQDRPRNDKAQTDKAQADKANKAKTTQWVLIDFQEQANQKLTDNFHYEDPQNPNSLRELPAGEQTLCGVKFKIGESCIQLGSKRLTDKPAKVEGIKVGKKLTKLHFLHALGFGSPAAKGPDGEIIGEYTVNWDDGSSVTIPLVFGKDILDWWYNDDEPEPTRAKVAWKGNNEYAKSREFKLRLYLTTWENTKPDKKIVSIDFSSTMETECAPFCVGMTGEEQTGQASDKRGETKFICLDLQPQANVRVHGVFGGDDKGEGKLAHGEQTLAGVTFKIGQKFIQLVGNKRTDLPAKVEGIKVGHKLARLHLLHGTGWFTDNGTIIGEYIVTWEDDTSSTIPIRYGKDLLDFWFDADSPEASDAKIAWTGASTFAQAAGKKVRLYLTTWENPKPDLTVKSIDISSTNETACEPMCLAITAQK